MMDNRNIWNSRIKEGKFFYSKEEEEIYNVFSEAINSFPNIDQWEIKHNVLIRLNGFRREEVDIIIFRKGSPYAVIEVRRNEYNLQRIISRIKHVAFAIFAPLWCVCIPTKMLYFKADEEPENEDNWVDLKVDNIKKFLAENVTDKTQDVKWDEFKTRCLNMLENQNIDTEKKEKLKSFFSGKNVSILNEQNSFLFENEKDEDAFFQILLGNYTKDKLCRYTTVSSYFRTCNDKEQSMCCIVCMNDKSEVNYVAKKLNIFVDSNEINKCFIFSCCDENRCNDFTMFRLYADDAKGVCLEYSIDKDLLQNSRFVLAPISYALDKEQTHPELDFVCDMVKEKIHGKKLDLRRLSVWSHFFKPFEYRDEQEVRLLFFQDKNDSKWIYETHFGIVTPIMTFPIEENNNQFPLILDKITLGPITKEADINIEQFSYLIQNKNIRTTGSSNLVFKSPISHYRGY